MEYISLDFRKTKGIFDTRMSGHIECRVIAPNVASIRTHLNCELVQIPEGIRECDDAIAIRVVRASERKITYD